MSTSLKLSKRFFSQTPELVAPALLGCKLTTCIKGVVTSGIIVEVEAYGGPNDQAAHSWKGKTPRNEVMFWDGGYCYVYFIYGMHYCVNVVTSPKDFGAAVLIRAVEPVEGIEYMRQRRGKAVHHNNLTNGPAKLCEALGIDKRMLGESLISSKSIWLESSIKVNTADIGSSRRVGISKSPELPWRFFLKGNRWVSHVP